jgi:hypothetical protein
MGATFSNLVLNFTLSAPRGEADSLAGAEGVAAFSNETATEITINGYGKVRSEKVNNREFLVAPLTLIVPGVLNGSQGPLYYPPDQISRNVDAWNGLPLVVLHPTRNGQHVSGRDPFAMANAEVGRVYNARIGKGGRLQAEGWFDVEATERVDHTKTIVPRLRRGEPIELSTGLYTKNVPEQGVFNGRRFTHVAKDYRPDHLAILPDRRGACSLSDGCGVLVNEQGDEVCANCRAPLHPGPCKGWKGAAPAVKAVPAVKALPRPAAKVVATPTVKQVKVPAPVKAAKKPTAVKPSAEKTGHPEVDKAVAAAKTTPDRVKAVYENSRNYATLTHAGKGGAEKALSTVRKSLENATPQEVRDTAKAIGVNVKGSKKNQVEKIVEHVKERIGGNIRGAMHEMPEKVKKKALAELAKAGFQDAAVQNDYHDYNEARAMPTLTDLVLGLVVNKMKPSTALKKDGMTPEKACKIMEDGKVGGEWLTKKQKGLFGALCGERKTNNTTLGESVMNAFCPTGKGGGIKTDCGSKGGGGRGAIKSAKPVSKMFTPKTSPAQKAAGTAKASAGAAKKTFGAGGKVAGAKGAGKTAPKAPAAAPAKPKTVVKVTAPQLKAAKKLAKAAADAKKKGDAEGEAKAKMKLKRIVEKAQTRQKDKAGGDKKGGIDKEAAKAKREQRSKDLGYADAKTRRDNLPQDRKERQERRAKRKEEEGKAKAEQAKKEEAKKHFAEAKEKRHAKQEERAQKYGFKDGRKGHLEDLKKDKKQYAEERASRKKAEALEKKAQAKGYGSHKERAEAVTKKRAERESARRQKEHEAKPGTPGIKKRTEQEKLQARGHKTREERKANLKFRKNVHKLERGMGGKGVKRLPKRYAANALDLASGLSRASAGNDAAWAETVRDLAYYYKDRIGDHQERHSTQPMLVGNSVVVAKGEVSYALAVYNSLIAYADAVLDRINADHEGVTDNELCVNCGAKPCGPCAAKAKAGNTGVAPSTEVENDKGMPGKCDVDDLIKKGRRRKKRRGNPTEPHAVMDSTMIQAQRTRNEDADPDLDPELVTNAGESHFSGCERDDKGHCEKGKAVKKQSCKCPDGSTVEKAEAVLPREQSGSVGGGKVSVAANAVFNVFCPTGPGGGIKPNCGTKSATGLTDNDSHTVVDNATPEQLRDGRGRWGTKDQVARFSVVSAVQKAFGPAVKVADPVPALKSVPAMRKAGEPLDHGDEAKDGEAAEAHSPATALAKSAAGQQGVSAAVANIFCPTGPGGGIKPNCGAKGGGGAASESVTKAIGGMKHVSTSAQAHSAAGDAWFNSSKAQKEFPNRKKFQDAVKAEFEKASGAK